MHQSSKKFLRRIWKKKEGKHEGQTDEPSVYYTDADPHIVMAIIAGLSASYWCNIESPSCCHCGSSKS